MNKRLDFINDKCLNKLKQIENNFNNLKDNFYELTKQCENKNSDNSEGKIISGPKSEAFEEVKTKYSTNMIKLNFVRIKKKEKFNCFHYVLYMIFCKKIIPQIQYYENLRRLIISEEIMFQNFL